MKKEDKQYKEPLEIEEETTINVLYDLKKVSIYTNNPVLQKQLNKFVGRPAKEFKIGKKIAASRWEISFSEKNKISQMMLKANIFEL